MLDPDPKRAARRIVRRKKTGTPVEIGWCELVQLPDLGLADMHAKIDTGARTSTLHAVKIKPFERAGHKWVRFVCPRSPGHDPQLCEAPLVERRSVTSSNGQVQRRYVIVTRMQLAGRIWMGELTLANRTTMAFPVLIGRRALRRGFLVNSARRYLAGQPCERQATS